MTTTCLYEPIREQRRFTKDKNYDKIDWLKFPEVLAAFKERIEGWYIEPCDMLTNHHSFAAMALMCLLIDTLSQYRYGPRKDSAGNDLFPIESDPDSFKKFVKEFFPIFSKAITSPIKYKRKNGTPKYCRDLADVLYHGFRCGILHSAHVPLFGVIHGETTVVKIESGLTNYTDGSGTCQTVVIDPSQLRTLIKAYWVQYLADLSNPDPYFNDHRKFFKMKFEDSFGVEISVTI